MNLLWRYPQHPGCLRFHQGTIIIGGLPNQECFFEHPIKRWYGIAFARIFIGIILTEPTIDVREAPKERVDDHNI